MCVCTLVHNPVTVHVQWEVKGVDSFMLRNMNAESFITTILLFINMFTEGN